MGQRHQAFVIARVVPHGQQQARYRCIGAIHHQWCYGSLPLMAAARFISLARQKDNAEIIREEISAIHGCYGEFDQEPGIITVPCPFTHFLLSSAWATDLSDPENLYVSSVATLDAGMGSKDGDNNDGITVIDVTDPENISYCFALSSTPISAMQYIRVYYEEPTESNESLSEKEKSQETLVQSAVGPLDSIPLIPEYHLAEAWPTEFKAKKQEETPSDSPLPSDSLPLHQPLSLVDLTLRPAVEQAILEGNISKLEPFIFSKADVMRDVIRSYKPIMDRAFSLLKKVIEVQRSNELDLSGFSLSGEQTLSLLTFTPENNLKLDIQILKLSHNDQIDIKTVQQVLELPSLTALRRLVLWNTAVSDADIIDLLEKRPQLFYRIEALIHPAFMKYSARPTAPTAFTHVSSKYSDFAQISIPYFTPGQIAQGLLDYLPQIYQMPLGDVSQGIPAMATYASEVRPSDKPWNERIVPFVPSYSSATKVKEGQWLFALTSSSSGLGHSHRYAFARVNVETHEEREAELLSIRAKQGVQRKDSEEVTAVRQKYESRMYDIHDVHSFFKELELEGRPAPVAQILKRLFDIFQVRDDGRHRHSKTFELMSSKSLDQFLVEADRVDQIMQRFRGF